jgi:hypothetical protein
MLLREVNASIRHEEKARAGFFLFVRVLQSAVLRPKAGGRSLKALPSDLQVPGYPVAILSLENRVLSPLVSVAPFIRARSRDREIDGRTVATMSS